MPSRGRFFWEAWLISIGWSGFDCVLGAGDRMDRVDLIVFLGLWVRLDGVDLMVFWGWGFQLAVGD